MIDSNNISLLKDKDKLFVVANICISNVGKEKGRQMLWDFKEYFSNQFDDTVKFFVMPVLEPSLQKLEILNPKFVDDDIIKNLTEKYEETIEKLTKNNK